MNSNLPISSAIQKIVALFGYEADISVNDFKNGKVYCVVDEKEEAFLNSIVNSCELLPPILVVSSKKIKDNPPLGLFKSLSEKYPDRFQYLECPFDIAAFISAKQKLSNQKGENPFKNFSNIIKDLKVLLSDSKESDKVANYLNIDSNSTGIFIELSKIALEEREDEKRLKRFHGISSDVENIKLSLAYECCLEYIYTMLEDRQIEKQILWIENNPDKLGGLPKFFKEYFGYKLQIEKNPKECYQKLEKGDVQYEGFNLFLVDIFLGDDEKLSGKHFLKILTQNYPHIPAFILSGSEDLELVSKTLKEGADFYIFKKYAVSIPYYFRKFHEKIGKIVLLINDDKLRKNLVGNIRTWRLNREKLWFGDKCYHMINHGFIHAEDDWKLMNQVFPSVFDILNSTAEDIYCLSMATWLHDIGHAGNERYGEPHLVRDNHSVISAEIILKHPENYGIFGYNEQSKSPYRRKWDPVNGKKTLLQCLRETVKKGNYSRLEKIALMCIYHSSKFPIDEEDAVQIMSKKKKPLSLECYENRDSSKKPICLTTIGKYMKEDNFLKYITILRFVDALDHNKKRVGDDTSRSIKFKTNQRDTEYQLQKLYGEVQLLSKEIRKGKKKKFKELFFDKVVDYIRNEKEDMDSIRDKQENFLKKETRSDKLDTTNYKTLRDYVGFLGVQYGHFDLHKSIEDIDIRVKENADRKLLIDIRFKTSKSDSELKKIMIKKSDDKKGTSLPKYLLGARDDDCKLLKKKDGNYKDVGYIGKELTASGEYVKDFIDILGHKAGIYDLDGKRLFPEKA